jgi:hypothetical protein
MQKCSNSRGFRFSAGKRTSAHRGDEAPEERLNRSELVYSVDRSRAEKLRALAFDAPLDHAAIHSIAPRQSRS